MRRRIHDLLFPAVGSAGVYRRQDGSGQCIHRGLPGTRKYAGDKWFFRGLCPAETLHEIGNFWDALRRGADGLQQIFRTNDGRDVSVLFRLWNHGIHSAQGVCLCSGHAPATLPGIAGSV